MYEEAIKILKKLNDNNYEAYIVGGYPRNKYLNIESSDIDICTSAKPEEVKSLFSNADLRNKKYGNAIIYINNYKFEVTTFRKDINYIKNRRPSKIEFVKTLNDDLKRRDFIMNTLCIDKNGNYIDLMGAKKDINNKIIRLVNDKKSLEDDALRIFRAIRFHITLDFKLDENLKEGIREYAYLIKNLPINNINYELDKMFECLDKDSVIKILDKYEITKYLEINN